MGAYLLLRGGKASCKPKGWTDTLYKGDTIECKTETERFGPAGKWDVTKIHVKNGSNADETTVIIHPNTKVGDVKYLRQNSEDWSFFTKVKSKAARRRLTHRRPGWSHRL